MAVTFYVRLFPLKGNGYFVWVRMESAMSSMRKAVSWKAFCRWLIERYVRFDSILLSLIWPWLLFKWRIYWNRLDEISQLHPCFLYCIIQLFMVHIIVGYWHCTPSPKKSSRHHYGRWAIEVMEVIVFNWNNVSLYCWAYPSLPCVFSYLIRTNQYHR